MNAIEHLWGEIGRRIKIRSIKNEEQLKNTILTEWRSTGPEITKKTNWRDEK
ncbi:hypothetical protein WH47_10936 [Habropoda laboriosa]|uniref:Uncharacterized protein n=1 Tax=Habropoda laboriosa TaxID=597456 RepID=A0A0L7QKM4_9HYME|nr:hypothetical protein WH47_10936 [Habropoda laboriosa]